MTARQIPALLFLLFSASSYALTTTSPNGEVVTLGPIQAGSAYIDVPNGNGEFKRYAGFENAKTAADTLRAKLLSISGGCGGGVTIGATTLETGNSSYTVTLNCKMPNGAIKAGLSGKASGSVCRVGKHENNMSSPTFVACALTTAEYNSAIPPIGDVNQKGDCNFEKIVEYPYYTSIGPAKNEWLFETDYNGYNVFPLIFKRFYNSGSAYVSSIGSKWSHTYNRKLLISSNENFPLVGAIDETGKAETYGLVKGMWVSDDNHAGQLTRLFNKTGWILANGSNEIEHYDMTGRLLSITNENDLTITLNYDQYGRIKSVSDWHDTSMKFDYDTKSNICSVTDPMGGIYKYAYDSDANLVSVTYPDGKNKQYLYSEIGDASTITTIKENGIIRRADYQRHTLCQLKLHRSGYVEPDLTIYQKTVKN